jgi:MFS family permease
VCVALNLAGTSLNHFWLALVALGVSWNFLFIGGTTLLTETYEQAERAKVQAANDFIIFTTVALASLSAGFLQHRLGWQAVNWGVVPLLLLILGSLGWLGMVSRYDRLRVQA